jgi:SAM-dependent methyltransferase
VRNRRNNDLQDLDPKLVAAANQALKKFNLKGEVVCGDAAELKFPDNHFDGVISSDFFEHITDETKVQVLREILRVLKPGKVAVIKTPNLSYLKAALLYKRLRAVARLRNPFKIVIEHTPGTDDPQHIGLVTRWQLTKCVYQAGFVNYQFFYAPLRRFGLSRFMEAISTEIPILRDIFCEEVFCAAWKPIALSYFPD